MVSWREAARRSDFDAAKLHNIKSRIPELFDSEWFRDPDSNGLPGEVDENEGLKFLGMLGRLNRLGVPPRAATIAAMSFFASLDERIAGELYIDGKTIMIVAPIAPGDGGAPLDFNNLAVRIVNSRHDAEIAALLNIDTASIMVDLNAVFASIDRAAPMKDSA